MIKLKHILPIIAFIAVTFAGCEEKTDLYNGPDLVHFSSVSSQMVIKERGDNATTITIGSTTVSAEDRTYSIGVDAEKSTAKEGVDFQFSSSEVVIPAGKVVADFDVIGLYDGASPDGTTLVLTIDEASAGAPAKFNDSYTLQLFKFCSFDRDAFIGTYHVYEHSYWGEFEYDITSVAGAASSVIMDGFWEVKGSKIEVVFDAYFGTCSIPAQLLFSDPAYGGRVYIESFESGTINSCNGTIEGLSFYIYGVDSGLLYDVVVADMYKKTAPQAAAHSHDNTLRKAQVVNDKMLIPDFLK